MIEHVDAMSEERYSEFAHDHHCDERDELKAAVRDGTSETTIDRAVSGDEQDNAIAATHVTPLVRKLASKHCQVPGLMEASNSR